MLQERDTAFVLDIEVLHLLHRKRVNIMGFVSNFGGLRVSLSPMWIPVTITNIACYEN